jgi:hypothetical protein
MTAVTEKQLGKGTRYPVNLCTTTEKRRLYAIRPEVLQSGQLEQ